jgi:hypothetical protein
MVHELNEDLIRVNVPILILHIQIPCLFKNLRYSLFSEERPKFVMNLRYLVRHQHVDPLFKEILSFVTKELNDGLIDKLNLSVEAKVSINYNKPNFID